jgi:DNA-binding CsgD family transcriptional regulator
MNTGARLTPRETEIAELLAWGAAKKEVADWLTISPRTVENTARNIYEKIGIQKATELCVWWFCTQFKISLDLSPIARSMVASVLLITFLCTEINHTDFCRYMIRPRSGYTIRNTRIPFFQKAIRLFIHIACYP